MTKSQIKKYAFACLVLFLVGVVLLTLAGLIYFYENASLKQDLVQVK